jgi:hypothetical protein
MTIFYGIGALLLAGLVLWLFRKKDIKCDFSFLPDNQPRDYPDSDS